MLQWNAKEILSFSLLMGMGISFSANAQQSNINQETSAESAVPSSLLEAKPVRVSPALAPAQVPVNVTTTVQAAKSQAASVVNGISEEEDEEEVLNSKSQKVSTNENKNGNGIQIFNLNTNDQDQEAEQDQNAVVKSESRSDVLRRERIRQELQNESRLIEKIEEDRISIEGTRANAIEGLAFANANTATASPSIVADDIEVIEVNASNVQAAPLGAVPVAISETSSKNMFSSTEFAIAPMAGYRWTPDNTSEFKSQNLGVAGVALEGRIGNVLGLEANYLYGRDNLKQRYYGGAGHFGGHNYNANANGFFQQIRTRDTHEFNANAKLGWFVGSIRPYAMAGVGALYTGYNIDDPYTKAQAESIGWKRSSTHMSGNVGGGVDVKLSRNFSLGTRVEYQYIFGAKNVADQYSINNIYGDTRGRIKAMGSLQVTF